MYQFISRVKKQLSINNTCVFQKKGSGGIYKDLQSFDTNDQLFSQKENIAFNQVFQNQAVQGDPAGYQGNDLHDRGQACRVYYGWHVKGACYEALKYWHERYLLVSS